MYEVSQNTARRDFIDQATRQLWKHFLSLGGGLCAEPLPLVVTTPPSTNSVTEQHTWRLLMIM
jgi:hypothetical protein